jgi:hypothetical protein
VCDPNFGQRVQDILGDIRPEAVYFAVADGQRTVYAAAAVYATWPMRGAVVVCYDRWRERGPLAAVDAVNRSLRKGSTPPGPRVEAALPSPVDACLCGYPGCREQQVKPATTLAMGTGMRVPNSVRSAWCCPVEPCTHT